MRRPRRRPWTINSLPCLRREARWSSSRHVSSRIHSLALPPRHLLHGGGQLRKKLLPLGLLHVDDEGAVIRVVVPRSGPAAALDPPPVLLLCMCVFCLYLVFRLISIVGKFLGFRLEPRELIMKDLATQPK